jgi:hypothetical protein
MIGCSDGGFLDTMYSIGDYVRVASGGSAREKDSWRKAERGKLDACGGADM